MNTLLIEDQNLNQQVSTSISHPSDEQPLIHENQMHSVTKIETVNTNELVMTCHNVRRQINTDGRLQPAQFKVGAAVDIIKCSITMYLVTNKVAFLLCLMLLALDPSACRSDVHVWTILMFLLLLINLGIGAYMVFLMGFFRFRDSPRMHYWSIGLGSVEISTRTTDAKQIYYAMYAQDIIAGLIILVGWPIAGDADTCEQGFKGFYVLLLLFFTFMVLLRLFFTFVHFKYGQTIYRRLKKRFQALNTVEFEHEIVYEIQLAQQYMQRQGLLDPRGKEIKGKELTCAICLEGFSLDQHPEQTLKNKLVSLRCNNSHVFHPRCIQEWLEKSQECPLCKVNVFTMDQTQA